MELETYEITLEDILTIHRDWITQLRVQDRKSEVEIVQVLQERGLLVTWVSSLHVVHIQLLSS